MDIPFRDISTINAELGNYALDLKFSNLAHINHGRFFAPATLYTSFFWEALVKPDGTGQYIVSAGYGGSHCMLFGANAAQNGICTVTGNVFLDGVSTSFTTTDGLRVNEWAHLAIAGDAAGQRITVIINP